MPTWHDAIEYIDTTDGGQEVDGGRATRFNRCMASSRCVTYNAWSASVYISERANEMATDSSEKTGTKPCTTARRWLRGRRVRTISARRSRLSSTAIPR